MSLSNGKRIAGPNGMVCAGVKIFFPENECPEQVEVEFKQVQPPPTPRQVPNPYASLLPTDSSEESSSDSIEIPSSDSAGNASSDEYATSDRSSESDETDDEPPRKTSRSEAATRTKRSLRNSREEPNADRPEALPSAEQPLAVVEQEQSYGNGEGRDEAAGQAPDKRKGRRSSMEEASEVLYGVVGRMTTGQAEGGGRPPSSEDLLWRQDFLGQCRLLVEHRFREAYHRTCLKPLCEQFENAYELR